MHKNQFVCLGKLHIDISHPIYYNYPILKRNSNTKATEKRRL